MNCEVRDEKGEKEGAQHRAEAPINAIQGCKAVYTLGCLTYPLGFWGSPTLLRFHVYRGTALTAHSFSPTFTNMQAGSVTFQCIPTALRFLSTRLLLLLRCHNSRREPQFSVTAPLSSTYSVPGTLIERFEVSICQFTPSYESPAQLPLSQPVSAASQHSLFPPSQCTAAAIFSPQASIQHVGGGQQGSAWFRAV